MSAEFVIKKTRENEREAYMNKESHLTNAELRICVLLSMLRKLLSALH